MAPKKTKAIPLKWIQQNIEEAESTLPASAIEFNDVLKMFGFTKGMRWSLQNYKLYDSPAALSVIQREADFVMEGLPENEAYTKCQLNNIWYVASQRRSVSPCRIIPHRLQLQLILHIPQLQLILHLPQLQLIPHLPQLQLILHYDPTLKYPVKYNNQTWMLGGIVDYTLRYDSAESVGTNLIIMEAKRRRLTGEVAGQVLAYMGIVHRTRLQEGRRNAVVYGISIDGDEFRFWRIDNDSTVSQNRLYEWSQGHEYYVIH
ncbi:MAG: hypothetical protein M1839_003869 [Geoglossum umbratile]|nr:MAG: hypothetical protein M1839_003869 [Geoglossum umbratile]